MTTINQSMAVADRHYMRDDYHPPRMTTILIVALIGAFVVQSLLLFYGGINLIPQLGLTTTGVSRGKIWQLLTFQFLHSAPWPWHVLFNCFGLYFFGRSVEETLGSRKFLWLYFISGVAGGLLQILVTLLLPNHEDIPVVGASAGVCGLIAIFCSMYPMRELTTWIYFFPITIRARYFLMFLGLFSLFGTLVPFDGVAHAAHLGGIALGIGYVCWGERFSAHFSRWSLTTKRRRKQELVGAATVRGRPWRESTKKETRTEPEQDFMSKQIDPILDKISAKGIHSLSDDEKRVLETARKRINRNR